MKFIILLSFISCVCVSGKQYIRVCYYTNWAQYRPPPMRFFPEDIDPFLCTHIMYAFAKIGTDKTLQPYEWNDLQMYPRIMALKRQNPTLRIHLAVGGWNHEGTATSKFSTMVNDNNNRRTFIASVVKTLRQYHFDGLDLDWEYPAGRNNSPPADKRKYSQLCRELIDAFDKDAANRMQARLSLSAAVAAGVDKIDNGYEIAELAKYIDLLNIMAYDFHGNFDKITGHHTAMDYDGGPGLHRKEYTVRYGVNYWLDGGFPADKIALGLATYGRPFRLESAENNGLAAAKSKWMPPRTGKYTRTTGFLSYYEICNKYKVVSENEAGAPYGYAGTDWCGFDTRESLIGKVKTLVVAKGLAGVMIWSLALDDFNGSQCGQGKNPLINSVKKYLQSIENPQLPKRGIPLAPGGPMQRPRRPVRRAPRLSNRARRSYNRAKRLKIRPYGRANRLKQRRPITRRPRQKIRIRRPFRRTIRPKKRPVIRANRRITEDNGNQRRFPRNNNSNKNKCRAIGAWSGKKALGLDDWCAANCYNGRCSSSLCQCKYMFHV